MPLPKRLYVPLQQHIGAPAKPVVTVGQQVLKGELIADSVGNVSARVHAPSSGTVVDIARHIREEAGQQLDARFDEQADALRQGPAPTQPSPQAKKPSLSAGKPLPIPVAQAGACCTPTKDGQSCC